MPDGPRPNGHDPGYLRFLVAREADQRLAAGEPELYAEMQRDRGFCVAVYAEQDERLSELLIRCEQAGAKLEKALPWVHPAVGPVLTLAFTTTVSALAVMRRIG